jgi:hypothetical protein
MDSDSTPPQGGGFESRHWQRERKKTSAVLFQDDVGCQRAGVGRPPPLLPGVHEDRSGLAHLGPML